MIHDEQMKNIKRNADLATACLVTVSCYVTMPNGHSFHCCLMPWDCLEKARDMMLAGATQITLMASGPGCCLWSWIKPKAKGRAHGRRVAVAA